MVNTEAAHSLSIQGAIACTGESPDDTLQFHVKKEGGKTAEGNIALTHQFVDLYAIFRFTEHRQHTFFFIC